MAPLTPLFDKLERVFAWIKQKWLARNIVMLIRDPKTYEVTFLQHQESSPLQHIEDPSEFLRAISNPHLKLSIVFNRQRRKAYAFKASDIEGYGRYIKLNYDFLEPVFEEYLLTQEIADSQESV